MSDPLAAAGVRALDALIEQLPVGVIVADAAGKITVLNTSVQQLMRDAGLDPEQAEAYFELPFLRANGTAYSRPERPLTRALERGEQTEAQLVRLELRDGGVRDLEIGARPLRDAAGAIAGAVAVVVDVTPRERRQRGEREFVANAAHQLRNPLAAIRSAIEVLQAGAKDDPSARDRFLGHIERESDRLARLARTLLVLARAQSTVEEPRREIVEVGALLRQVVSRLNPGGVEVVVECALGSAAVANPDLLEEALVCLADNAVRYAGETRVVISAQPRNGGLVLEVKDSGRGLPAHVRERLFSRFNQAGRDGFGLGLAIAAQATEATGGTLEIDSDPDRGTAARITVPAARMLTQ
jgi:PAS domain S-box-containing protein